MSTRDEIDISICICARNRPDELGRALASVLRSSLAPKQIVVSDDSDDDRVAALVSDHPLPITYTRGPRSGLGANRNNAISLAVGEHLLFLDDDACLGEDFLSTMAFCLLKYPSERRARMIVTGIETQDNRPILPRDQGFLGFQSRKYRQNEPMRTVVINAALFPRSLFDKVGFDPSLIYGYDEVDITTQAVALGFTITPCFDAANSHYPSSTGRDEYRPYIQASRLYVTLKRRRWTEGSWLRGWGGFWLGAGHVYLAGIKRGGLSGVGDARRSVARALSYYTTFVESKG